MRIARWAVLLAAVAMLAGACGGDGGGGGGGGEGDLSMRDNEFDPTSLSVPAGSITVVNDGSALHSFTVSDEGIDVDVQPGQSETVDVSVDPGEYPFVCKYHPEMTGTLTVE